MAQLRGHINDSLLGEEELGSDCYGTPFSHQIPFLQLLQGTMQEEEPSETKRVRLHLHDLYKQPCLFTSHPQSLATNFHLFVRTHSSQAPEKLESCITHASELPPLAVSPSPNEPRKQKRKRPAPASKNSEAAECQRMTHIAVERNRRRLMNDHYATFRSLIPSSFVQRGDQASIIGGAIEFVKVLEQRLLCLRAEKRRRAELDTSHAAALHDGFFVSPQYTGYSRSQRQGGDGEEAEVDVEATLVQGHVNLKVAGRWRRGQLVRAIAAMEELQLSVLHLNITKLEPSSSVLYSLNLKMEEECKLKTADEIATAVQQIFVYINSC